jgi:hypothetical protein
LVNQKSETVLSSKLLFTVRMEHTPTDSERSVTGDESWFFLYYPHPAVWVASRSDVSHRVKHKMTQRSAFISIFWSVHGIHSLADVPKGTMCRTVFFTDVVMSSLIKNITSRNRRKTMKGCLIHMDNSPPHSISCCECMRVSKAEGLFHPASSPDIAPSDFFLF